jgi:hypothetical protein
MAKTGFEQRSILNELKTFLESRGYIGMTFTDGYQPEAPITPPQITVTFPPSSPVELQLGRTRGSESLYRRTVLINAYMETERRATDIIDEIMDFLEFECVDIKDPQDTFLGYVQCNAVQAIVGQVFPPVMGDPKNIRWRGAVTAPMESFYPNA